MVVVVAPVLICSQGPADCCVWEGFTQAGSGQTIYNYIKQHVKNSDPAYQKEMKCLGQGSRVDKFYGVQELESPMDEVVR